MLALELDCVRSSTGFDHAETLLGKKGGCVFDTSVKGECNKSEWVLGIVAVCHQQRAVDIHCGSAGTQNQQAELKLFNRLMSRPTQGP